MPQSRGKTKKENDRLTIGRVSFTKKLKNFAAPTGYETNRAAAEAYHVEPYQSNMSLQQYQDFVQQYLALNIIAPFNTNQDGVPLLSCLSNKDTKESIVALYGRFYPTYCHAQYKSRMLKAFNIAQSITNFAAKDIAKGKINLGKKDDKVFREVLDDLYHLKYQGKDIDLRNIFNPNHKSYGGCLPDYATLVEKICVLENRRRQIVCCLNILS